MIAPPTEAGRPAGSGRVGRASGHADRADARIAAAGPARAFRVGDLECVSLSDGYISAPVERSNPEVPPDELRRFLESHGERGEIRRLQLSCLSLRLLDNGERVLVDGGLGAAIGPDGQPVTTAGHVLAALDAAGIAPTDVDLVLVSHIHPDHVGGLFDEKDRAVYPNAVYCAGREEVAFWSGERPDLSGCLLPPPMKADVIRSAGRFLELSRGRLRTFAAGDEVAAGVRSVPLPGHTPGQVGFLFESRGESLLYTADALAHPFLSLLRPEWRSAFDTVSPVAVETRKRIISRIAANRWMTFTPHFTWPSFGRIVEQDGQHAWHPS